MNSTRLTAAVDAACLSPRRQPVDPFSGCLHRHCIPGCLYSTNIIAPIGAKFTQGHVLVANYGGQDANLDDLSHWMWPVSCRPWRRRFQHFVPYIGVRPMELEQAVGSSDGWPSRARGAVTTW
jgi:hypothetical protein